MKRKPGTSKRKTRKLNTIMRDKKIDLKKSIYPTAKIQTIMEPEKELTIEQINDIGMSGIEGAAAGKKLIETMNKIDKAHKDAGKSTLQFP